MVPPQCRVKENLLKYINVNLVFKLSVNEKHAIASLVMYDIISQQIILL